MKKLVSRMIACGGYLPKNIMTNHDLAKTVDTSHDWIVERTGIHQRHFAAADEYTSDMACAAAQDALKKAGLQPNDIDLIIVGTSSPDNTFPSCATRVQAKIGNTKGLAFDVAAACTGFLLALGTADQYLRDGKAKRALVIGAEKISSLLDMTDRTTCVLFGDGAGAVILEATESQEDTEQQQGVIDVQLESDGRFFDILHTDGGTSSTATAGHIKMTGPEVFKQAVTKLADSAESMLKRHGLNSDQIDWMIPHQANIRIIEAVMRRLDLPEDRVVITVDRHANTSAASIPLALNDAVSQGKIKPGDLILHEAFGGGLVWGAALVRFG